MLSRAARLNRRAKGLRVSALASGSLRPSVSALLAAPVSSSTGAAAGGGGRVSPAAAAAAARSDPLRPSRTEFEARHIGPREGDVAEMLKVAGGFSSLEEMTAATVPSSIRLPGTMGLPAARTEQEALAELRAMADKNVVNKSYIGMGYYGTHTPGVILRNILENPAWYTSYTPYQAEISQGRLEMLLNFQTMVTDLTGMDVSNASLLDESTAAAEAVSLCIGTSGHGKRNKFFVAHDCHPQNIAVIETRCKGFGIEVVVGDPFTADFSKNDFAGILVQYPNTFGHANDFAGVAERAHAAGTLVVAATDLLALTTLKAPGAWGADVVVGSAQRFGVPMGYGGPHAGFLAAKDEFKRKMPGRIIGVSRDMQGNPALRMSMQTREQHIRRDKATSNICTAQALLANMAASYAIYHGPEGLRDIAARVNNLARTLAEGLRLAGCSVSEGKHFFDTLDVDVRGSVTGLSARALAERVSAEAGGNLRVVHETDRVSIALDETTTKEDILALLRVFGSPIATTESDLDAVAASVVAAGTGADAFPAALRRDTPFLTHPVFHSHRSESQMLRYLYKLQTKDLSLATSMITLGSCTMKLNATSEMIPITWPEFANLHPFCPPDQAVGMHEMIDTLSFALARITGFAGVSVQPNSGAQGEYAGLRVIAAYLESIGQGHRNVCLIPASAHGTNPASAVMAGMKVVGIKSDDEGNVDLADLKDKVAAHKDNLAALMVTYPSTFGVFEEEIKQICSLVHDAGGQVYMDGANMNAQVGLTSPGEIGADVCHLNLHKTFCIPHGGGGPGVGAIGVARHLAPFLPGHPVVPTGGFGPGARPKHDLTVSAAPYGSALILPISWMYIRMMGEEGLRRATQVAILNANYMARRLDGHFKVLYRGKEGMAAHEFIIDIRPFKAHGVTEEDVAKRMMDYGFHAPTMSWPVPGTLMIEPTESEDKGELDRFCDALISIRGEIEDVIAGRIKAEDSPLKFAPHSAGAVLSDSWSRKYSRKVAAYPAPWTRSNKFWPSIGRVDNVFGDRHLVCSCPPMESYLDPVDEAKP